MAHSDGGDNVWAYEARLGCLWSLGLEVAAVCQNTVDSVRLPLVWAFHAKPCGPFGIVRSLSEHCF